MFSIKDTVFHRCRVAGFSLLPSSPPVPRSLSEEYDWEGCVSTG